MTTHVKKLRKAIGESFIVWAVVGYIYRIVGISIVALANNRTPLMRPVGYAMVGAAAVGLVWAFPNPKAHSLSRRVAGIGYIVGAISALVYSLDRWVFPPRTYWPSAAATLVCLVIWFVGMRQWGKKPKVQFKPFMDHDILNVEDLGEDLEGKGQGWRKIRVQVLHKHGSNTFMTTDEESVPINDGQIMFGIHEDGEE